MVDLGNQRGGRAYQESALNRNKKTAESLAQPFLRV